VSRPLQEAAPAPGPWNPGIESPVPAALRPLCTVFRPENVFTPLAQADELHDFTGLDAAELVTFRPRRLALHELLIRVSADYSVPDGQRIEDLGINFRRITADLFEQCIAPRVEEIDELYGTRRGELLRHITAELGKVDADPERAVARWEARSHSGDEAAEASADRALARVVSALLVRHGCVWGPRELIATVAANLACNEFGSEEIGRLIDPWVTEAARVSGYRLLPRQDRPVVMNTKGASASGKSTIRPLQKGLASDLGTSWSEFALISPDIWRKQLLDYGSLGEAFRYGGAFTGDELRVVDQKLDRYMARKAARGHISHLLIDRFRFDSFAPDSDVAGSNLLTRFGQVIYLFFMITPPASLVERAWQRGLQVGRYKAVDDTLAHGVEAYAGMPQLFFTWVRRTDKRVHFEFLDNTVTLGERPRTVAFGWNDVLNVLDVKSLLDVERFRRVDIDARSPASLFRDRAALAPEKNTGFLRECIARFSEVNFADQATGRVYLRLVSGSPVWLDPGLWSHVAADADVRAGLAAVAPGGLGREPAPGSSSTLGKLVAIEHGHTIGRWGDR
jgi:hypothetical protein